ncbi:MAG: type IV pilus assembly protein PilM [Armatimonadota bacterium]
MGRKAPPSAMVGLDIGTDSIKVAEARFGKDGISITALGVAKIPEGVIDNEVVVDPRCLGNAIKALLAECGIKTRQVTSSVAGQSGVVVRVIEVPKMAPEELADTMKWELERQVPWPPSEVIHDYQLLEKPNADPNAQNAEVLLAVARQEVVDSHVETLLAAGLRPVAIDIEALAAGRALIDASTNGAKDQIVAIVNIGATDTELGIFEKGILTFPSPPLSIAGESFTREIAESLGQSLEQAETTKKEYASVRLDGFGAAPADVGPAAPEPGPPSPEPTSFDTAVGPVAPSATAFDLGEESGAAPAAFRETLDGPVFDLPDLATTPQPDVEPEPGPIGVPAFDLDEEPAAPGAPVFDLGDEEPPAETPAGPVFDLEEEPAPAQPLDLGGPDQQAAEAEAAPGPVAAVQPAGESIEERVFAAISSVLVDLANELRRSIEYYSTRYGRMPERIFLCGGTAKMPHLDEFLTRELGIPVEVADPVKNFNVKVPGMSDRYLKEISPMLSVAVGLAIRDMIG